MARKELKASDMKGKELKELARALIEQGFTVSRSANGHIMVHKDGKLVTTFSGSPSDPRSYRNAIAAARRAGFVWRR